ncbi:lytic murein transglycosylase [Agrobacterium salinitolerans]|nr:lytic murein transglycosylase [Agrobacterium salinitolerans]
MPTERGVTPLCPAGHLPLKGGDRSAARSRPSRSLGMKRQKGPLPISPLEGEMPGRAEGGKAPRAVYLLANV